MTKWTLLINLIRFVVAVGLVALVLAHANINQVFSALRSANLLLVVAALGCLAVTVLCNAIRWRAIVSLQTPGLSIPAAILGTFEGMFFNLFLPTSVGGDVGRAYRAFDKGIPLGVAVQSGIIDRALGLLAVGALLLVGCGFDPRIMALSWFWVVEAVAVAGLLGGVTVVVLGNVLHPDRLPRWLGSLVTLAKSFGDTIATRRFVTELLPLTLIGNLVNCLALWLCARATFNQVGGLDAVMALEASSLAALVPVSIGGWGVREGATALIFAAVGNPTDSSVAAALVYGVVLILIGLFGAAVWLLDPYRRSIRTGKPDKVG